ncbi:MAG TPA: LysR family transcriptional regulator [Rhodocyclaceae bacterium]|nr:LysR family transcriptional regulator [Rhodocyclaceae bacterium]
MDRLDAMRLFVRVAELGSFSAVAKQIDLARSVVTRQVAALESRLGVKLMARSTRRLTLTAAGAAYLEKCRVILNLVETAESEVAEERHTPRGPIRLTVPLSYGLKRLAPLLLDFAGRHAEIGLDMDYSDRRANLIEEGIDLAIRIATRLEPGEVARRLASEPLRVVASPDYLARHGVPRHPNELIHHECLGYTLSPGHAWPFLVDGRLESFPVRSRISANNGDALMAAAAGSLGITCQPELIAGDYLADGRVQEILAGFRPPDLGVWAVLPGNRYVPHRVRALMDWLAPQLASRA